MIYAALFLVALDLTLTVWAVRRWGTAVEFNPVWRTLMTRGGLGLFIVGYLSVWAILLAVGLAYELVFIIVAGLIIDTFSNLAAIRANIIRQRA